MNGMSEKNLKRLGNLIEILGHDGLDIALYKHRQSMSDVDIKMAKIPKRFSVKSRENTGTRWKRGIVFDDYGVHSVEVTMFYNDSNKELKGGE